jgi:co-chaperonin GroES (HSP10)
MNKNIVLHKAGPNRVVIRTKKTKQDEIKLNVLDQSGSNITLALDTDFNPEENAVITAEVVAVPEKLGNNEVTRKYYGYPVCHQVQEERVRYSDLPIEVLVGDKVYFHFHALDEETFLFKEDEFLYFSIEYHQIFCSVRNGEIIPIAGQILVEPYYGNDIQEIELPGLTTIKGKTNSFGIITSIHEEPQYLRGVIKHASAPIGFENIELRSGDHILYTIDSDFENEIEGKKYYVMKSWDVFATFAGDQINPIGSWLMVDAEWPEDKTRSGVFLAPTKKEMPKSGIVKKAGSGSLDVKNGDKILFEGRSPNFTQIDEFIFVKEQDVFGIV